MHRHCILTFHNLILIHFYSFLHILHHLHILLINKLSWLIFSSSLLLLFQLILMTNLKLGSSFDSFLSKDNVLLYYRSYRLMAFCLKQSFYLIKPLKYSFENCFKKRTYHQDVSWLNFLDKHKSFFHYFHKQQRLLRTELVDNC